MWSGCAGNGRVVIDAAAPDKGETSVTKPTLTTLALLVLASPVAADEPKPKADPAASMAVEADVAAIGPPPGVMAGVVARYDADRGSIVRSAPPRSSKTTSPASASTRPAAASSSPLDQHVPARRSVDDDESRVGEVTIEGEGPGDAVVPHDHERVRIAQR